MAEAIEWPTALKQIDQSIPYLTDTFKKPGVSLTGISRGVNNLAARWVYSFTFKVWTYEEHISWQSFLARNYGMSGLVRVPFCGCKFLPRLIISGQEVKPSTYNASGVTHDDGALHSDGTGYSQDMLGATALGAAAGATQMDITSVIKISVWPGHMFSDGHRTHTVTSVTPLAGNKQRLTFTPRLRAEIKPWRIISFSDLHCIMRVSSEDSLAIQAQLLKFGQGNISFEETIL